MRAQVATVRRSEAHAEEVVDAGVELDPMATSKLRRRVEKAEMKSELPMRTQVRVEEKDELGVVVVVAEIAAVEIAAAETVAGVSAAEVMVRRSTSVAAQASSSWSLVNMEP